MAHIQIITYEEYESDKSQMRQNDQLIHDSFRYSTKLNDVEQMIASLKCIIPTEIDFNRYETIAKEKSVTGMAHNLAYK